MKSQKTECTLCLNYDTSVQLRPAAAAMEGLGIHLQKEIFSAVSSEIPYFHFAILLVIRVKYVCMYVFQGWVSPCTPTSIWSIVRLLLNFKSAAIPTQPDVAACSTYQRTAEPSAGGIGHYVLGRVLAGNFAQRPHRQVPLELGRSFLFEFRVGLLSLSTATVLSFHWHWNISQWTTASVLQAQHSRNK
jgi:hypothetical protein